ncbi:TMEM165/GDT1 family protein [Arsenicicoccus piscis]|uniref:TMEM165/GDT1 family protein n=1 Tax=Arsenicicoccus piscis TaxID=673954 RepID=UPI001F4D3411|nr:TMEM165/GDT1 family protein [Arsenicicoccus piscis]MCH8629317.1 TMEM165/GDT1 family protein [Arsenicicoccus piscis]
MLAALWLSFVVIFVAELGDKSQLMAMTFATRFRPVPVLVAITIATALVHLASVGIGAVLGYSIPTKWITTPLRRVPRLRPVDAARRRAERGGGGEGLPLDQVGADRRRHGLLPRRAR